jgi:hypothetical protein
MTGPGHYREAERLLGNMDEAAWQAPAQIAAAQVHATLALAAATALVMADPGTTPQGEFDAWQTVAGPS